MVRFSVMAFVLGSALCQAEPYWCEYDPSGGLFPEEMGWTRITHEGGAERYFEDGALVLDGLASSEIVDYYRMSRPGALDPDPGELFVVQWRLRVDQVVGWTDPGIELCSDESRAVTFAFTEESVRSGLEPGSAAAFEAHVYHEYEVRSADMLSYELLIDGVPALAGEFHQVVSASRVGWGDGGRPAASLAQWDYLRYGVIPEPASEALMLAAFAALGCACDRRRRAT